MGLVTVTRQFTVPAGSRILDTVYTVTPGKRFRLEMAEIWFPPGTNNELRVVLLRGVSRIIPSEGYVVGDGETFTFKANVEYGSQEAVKALLINASATSPRMAQITITGVEE